jgi:hypothetical protein
MEPIIEPTAIMDIGPIKYDSAGAALFIIVVILWYCVGAVCMLGMQIPARAVTIEDSARRRTKFFIETLRDQTQTKQILGIIFIILLKEKIILLIHLCFIFRRTC